MDEQSASEQIDDIVILYGGWKGALISRLREIITQTDLAIIEEIKWKMRSRPEGLPVWSHNGILCMTETFKDNIKLVFPKGVRLDDPKNLFNARLMSKSERAIEFHDGDNIDEVALNELVLEAVMVNTTRR